MSITYYARFEQELPRVHIETGEIAIYVGSVIDGLRTGPTSRDCAQKVYVYRWMGDRAEEIDAGLAKDSAGSNMLDITAGADRYIFVRNEAGTFLRQISGPDKPVTVGNIGADSIRVDTGMGKFMVPAGTVLRLDRDAPFQRERKKVLLTFSEPWKRWIALESALLLDEGRWKPLNICHVSDDRSKIKDGPFTVCELTCADYGAPVMLEDLPSDPDYELYFRSTIGRTEVRFAGVGMKDEGLVRELHDFCPKQDVVYDLQELRQAPADALMERCTVQLSDQGMGGLAEQDVRWPGLPEDERSYGVAFPPLPEKSAGPYPFP